MVRALRLLVVLASLAPQGVRSQPVGVDPALVSYAAVGGVSGNRDAIGSDTLNNLMTLWAEAFRRIYPSVRIQIEGKGSSTAPPALISGTAQIGPMSRAMKGREIDRFGYDPTRLRVAIDALAVYVNKDNPVERLTLPEVDAIFSRSRRCGHATPITTWGQAGAEGSWRALPVRAAGGPYGGTNPDEVTSGRYPLSRFLFLYVNKAPNEPLDPLVRDSCASSSPARASRPW
jgi:phosphate transport system substrate-binding protein